MWWWAIVLGVAVAVPGCRKDGPKQAKTVHDAGPVLPPAPADDPDPPAVETPIASDPVTLDTDVSGKLDLDSIDLPAISDDGHRIARIDRGFDGDHRRLAVRVLDVDSGRTLREVVVFDPKRDLHRGKEPVAEKLASRLRRANALVSNEHWLNMIVPDSVLPDGWIRCRKGKQSFEVAGVEVTYNEPRLLLQRGKAVLDDRAFPDWVAKPHDHCEARSYIADAAIDPKHGVLMLEIQYCGDCGIPPRVAIVRFATGS